MTYDAVERRGAQAVLWSETVYPTTFGQPKSEAGAEFDREILQFVDAARVPLVFGTYTRDAQGEYNAAAFVAPGAGLLGAYRKTRLFPFTEQVPAWLDGPALRRLLPWAGSWRPGSGARVMPLRLADGREIPVLPLVCLDDMDTGLAVEGARQGAQVILTMSNDAWFSASPLGARLHQAAAAMRSVETRLPQFRVTSNGFSAVIDARGNLLNATLRDQRTLVIGEVPVREPPRTLAVAWGPWPGPAAAVLLGLLLLWSMASAAWSATAAGARSPGEAAAGPGADWTARVWVLPPAARWACVLLRTVARGALLAMGAAMLMDDGALLARPLAQIRLFVAAVLVPELAAWLVLQAGAARAAATPAGLVLTRGGRQLLLAPTTVSAVAHWRLPWPAPGVCLRLADGSRLDLAGVDPLQLQSVLAPATVPTAMPAQAPRALLHAHAVMAARPQDRRLALLAHPALKFGLLPLLLALPAFRLHQHIAYGGSFGEWQSFGAPAWFSTLLLWWAGWVIGTAIAAAVLRGLIEAAALLVLALRPQASVPARRLLERLGLALFYLGLPAWLALRLLAA
jgi:apolipoprotein N-acyltransferase